MPNDLDTSWFDLKNYDSFKSMPTKDWIYQLMMRELFQDCAYDRSKYYSKNNPGTVDWIFQNLVCGVIPTMQGFEMERYDGSRAEQVNDPFVTASVNPIKSSEIWAAVNDNKLCDIWNACQLDVDLFERSFNDPSFDFSLLNQDNEFSEIAKAPHDFNLNKYFPHKLAHILIDLNATDEQIKKDFDQILLQYRMKFSSEHPKKIFTRADFDYWIEYSVIPYLDLMIISKLTGKKITQSKLAKLIFPNEYDVDITERLRKVTKPTAKWLIENQIYSTISSQLFYKKLIGTKKA